MSPPKPRPSMAVSRALADAVVRPKLKVERTANVLFVLDRSQSMQAGNAIGLQDAATASIVKTLADPAECDAFQLAIIAYNHEARTLVPWTPATAVTTPRLSAEGQTCFGAAVEAALRVHAEATVSASAARPATVFLTDGQHVSSRDPFADVAALQRISDVVTIGLGDSPDMGFLRRLASAPHFCTRTTDPTQLRALFASVATALSASRSMGGLTAASADPFASRQV